MADGKKTYEIIINGLKESIDAVTSLNTQLDALEQKINQLQSRNITINSNVTTTTDSSRSSELEQEDKLLRDIQNTEERIADVRRDEYQELLNQKEILKELKKEGASRFAEDNLAVKEYDNTMAGLKAHLADVKKAMQFKDIDSDEFKKLTQQANELTTKLKGLEEAYGQFGRNVGNYKSAFEGLKDITVNVGGIERTFNSTREASRELENELKALVINGKQDTKEFKELSEAVHNFELAMQRANSVVNDLKASSKGMDNMLDMFESFGAMGQITQGFSGLFGLDDTQIEKSIQKLVALQNVMKGIEKIRKQLNTQEGIGEIFAKGSDKIDAMAFKMKRMTVAMLGTGSAAKVAAVGIKALGTAMKGLATMGLAVVLDLIVEGITSVTKAIGDWVKGDADLVSSEKLVEAEIDNVNHRLEERNNQLEKAYYQGVITQEELFRGQLIETTKAINEQIDALRERASFKGGKLEDNFASNSDGQVDLSFGGGNVKAENLEELTRLWKFYAEAVGEGRDAMSKLADEGGSVSAWFRSFVYTLDDTKDDMVEIGQVAISTFLGDYQHAMQTMQKDTNEGEKEIAKLKKAMNDNEMLRSVLLNIDQYIPDEEARKRIENIITAIRGLKTEMDDVDPSNTIRSEQLKIDAMKDGAEKREAQRKLDKKKELADATLTAEDRANIELKYQRRKEKEEKQAGEKSAKTAKETNKKIESAMKELNALRIENMDDGLEKELAKLDEEERLKIEKAKETGVAVAETTAEIEKLYDKKREDAKEQWAQRIQNVYNDMWKKIFDLNHKNAQLDFENQEKELKLEYKKLQEDLAWMKAEMPQYSSVVQYEIDKDNGVNQEKHITEILTDEFNARLKALDDYNKEYERLELERIQKEQDIAKSKSEENKNAELRSLKNSYAKEDMELQIHLKKGEITQKQYDEATQRLTEERADNEARILEKYRKEDEERERNHQNEIKRIKSQVTNNEIQEYERQLQNLAQVQINYQGLSIKRIKEETRKNLEAYDNYIKKVEDALKKLEKNKANMNPIDYEAQRKALQKIIDDAKKRGQELTDAQAQAILDAKERMMEYARQALSIFSDFVSSMLDSIWSNEDLAYQKQVDKMDKLIDKARKKYDEMDSLAEEHKSNMETIEDQIANAQGDARDHLIARYNAEMLAERDAIKQKKEAAKEEEKLEKQKEKMDLEQRKKQKSRDLIQAAINAAMAISMAAVNHWPTPAIPMMAMAAAASAAQIAAIAAKNYYAKGGQLDGGVAQGHLHRDGGIKVLGGRAEIEGGEYITNRVTTSKNIELLDYINSKKKKLDINDLIYFYGFNSSVKKNIQTVRTKFADGGQIPTLRNDIQINDRLLNAMEDYSNRPVQVAVVDIIDKTEDVQNVKVIAGIE